MFKQLFKPSSEIKYTPIHSEDRLYSIDELFNAVAEGNTQFILNNKISGSMLDVKNKQGVYLLFHAIDNAQINMIELLIEKGIDLKSKSNNQSVFIYSVLKSALPIAQLLLEKGISDDISSEGYYSTLNYYEKRKFSKLICKAIEQKMELFVRILIEKKFYYVNEPDSDENPLLTAVEMNLESIVRLLLSVKKFDINYKQKNYDKNTALHLAVKEKSESITKLLFEYGAKTDVFNDAGYTPLHLASKYGLLNIAQLHIQHGASVRLESPNGKYTALHFAALHDKVSLIIDYYLQNGADINARSALLSTPLMIASSKGNFTSVQILIKRGAELNYADKNGDTALHIAAREGYFHIALCLIQNGANSVLDNNYQQTPYEVARSKNHLKIQKILKIEWKKWLKQTLEQSNYKMEIEPIILDLKQTTTNTTAPQPDNTNITLYPKIDYSPDQTKGTTKYSSEFFRNSEIKSQTEFDTPRTPNYQDYNKSK